MFRGRKYHEADHFYSSLVIGHFSNEDDKANENIISVSKITFEQSYLFCDYHLHLVCEILYK